MRVVIASNGLGVSSLRWHGFKVWRRRMEREVYLNMAMVAGHLVGLLPSPPRPLPSYLP
jgi:hypothetical protein